MKRNQILLALVLASSVSLAADVPLTFAAAKKMWEQSKDRKEYQTYLEGFVKFNNYYRLDEKNGCYAMGKEQVELMLVVKHHQGEQYASIDQVLSDVDSVKGSCFKKTYGGIQVKVPPFLPFVVQMTFQ